MRGLKELIEFLDKLDEKKIYYRLNKIRDSILVEVTVPGQRWEIEFMADGSVEVEKFQSDGVMFGCEELDVLFRDFID